MLKSADPRTPLTSFQLVDPSFDVDIRLPITCHVTSIDNDQLDPKRFERFSSWTSLTRAAARLVHVAHPFKQGSSCKGWHIHENPCPKEDLEQAKSVIIDSGQHDVFREEVECIREGKAIPKQSPLYSLCPYLDKSGLLRIGGRLSQASLSRDEINPLILPGQSHITALLIQHYHERVQHQGHHITEGAVRAAGH